ncbi:HAD family hydrolase, partial [uncultured Muribaculum sp.]
MKRTLYVTDMDGTLLDDNSRVSPESAEIITDLTQRGALITVATARTPATVNPLLAHTVTSLPAIVMTGATLWDRNTMRYID